MRVSHRQLINSNPPPLKAEGDFFMLNILNNNFSQEHKTVIFFLIDCLNVLFIFLN